MKREARLIGGLLFCLLAWGLRAAVVEAHGLHPDEALHGSWGLSILSGRDPWLATVPVYKPPLLPYLVAASLGLAGHSPLAVRLPGLAAGVVTVGLTGRLAGRLYRDPLAGLAATAVAALSPFGVLFSAAGFADPLMIALGLAGCVAAAEGRPGWAGALAGLSFAAKQTGLLWLPLIVLCGARAMDHGPRTTDHATRTTFHVSRLTVHAARFVLCFLLPLGTVLAWDWVRTAQGAQSFWQAGVEGYGGLRLIWPTEAAVRLGGWLGWLRSVLGSLPLDALLVVGIAVLIVRALRHGGWDGFFDLGLAGFCAAYLLLLWLVAFPVWDRYLLPLLPPVAVLVGRVVSTLARRVVTAAGFFSRFSGGWVAASLALLLVLTGMAVPAARAVGGQVPVGAGLRTYDGIERVTDFLGGLPAGSVVYHHWLGWEYGFYLFDAPLYLAYWPTATWLARDVQAFGAAEPRYITFPAWESSPRVEAALAAVGYRLEPALRVREEGELRFTVYRVVSDGSDD